jgi:hypothetical protein
VTRRRKAKAPAEARCVKCGCTDSRACAGGCSWATVDRKAGVGICSSCLAPRTVSGTWQPHTVRPTEPTSALIAVRDADDGLGYLLATVHDFDLRLGRWVCTLEGKPLADEVFMWLDEHAIAPDDLFQQVTP